MGGGGEITVAKDCPDLHCSQVCFLMEPVVTASLADGEHDP